ncbi:MAG: beta-hydroxyacyl-ACP dehydratase [Candidatus Thorarchaeota archaeon]|nr:MAG: beta-hydroxyacyl-ACP dehydratase [Candidatus Thorarchaeota archaeon]
MSCNAEDIRQVLPHRYPYLMIDRILEQDKEHVIAVKNVTINEPFFQGHFPEPFQAIMPGTLILEAMAQTAAFLLAGRSELGFLVKVDKARFRRKVIPGDQLILSASRLRQRDRLLQIEAEASVNNEIAATAIISILVEDKGNETKAC